MYSYDTRVVFVCRLCKASFQIVDDFIEHKKKKHSVEFRDSNCIVFEDVLILNTNTDDSDDDDRSSMLSTVNPENLKKAALKDLNFGVDLILNTQDSPHDPADSFDPLSTSEYDSQNDGSNENTSYHDNDEAFNDILQENQDNYQVVDSSQVPPDVSYECIVPGMELVEFEIDCENNSLIQSVQNPFVLLKRLSSKEIQKLSRTQIQETIEMEVTPESPQCEMCLKEFKSEAELEIHYGVCILDHDNNSQDLDLYCSACNKFFNSKWARNIHQIRLHETEEEQRRRCKFQCTVCPKVYWRKDSLMHHMDSHRQANYKTKRVKCDHCSSSFRDKCDLTRHYQAKHALGTTRPFLCYVPNSVVENLLSFKFIYRHISNKTILK